MGAERFKSVVAVLIALVTILGASAACLSAVAVSQASDQDFFGMSAAINAQRAEIINRVNAFEHARAFATFRRYFELGNLLWNDSADKEAEVAAQMQAQSEEYWGLAGEMRQTFFFPRYVGSDGTTYDIERELQEEWADDLQTDDLESGSYFAASDLFRTKSSLLAGDMIVFALAFWFLTLAQVTESRLKYVWSTLGVIAGLAGILGIIFAEVML
jgi:hypothetical protein